MGNVQGYVDELDIVLFVVARKAYATMFCDSFSFFFIQQKFSESARPISTKFSRNLRNREH